MYNELRHAVSRTSFYVWRFSFRETSKVIIHAPPAAARPAIAGLTIPQPRPPVITCVVSAAETPAIMVTRAPDAEARRTYSPARIGTNSERVDDAAECDREQRPGRAADDGGPPRQAQHEIV